MDAVVNNMDAVPALLRNVNDDHNHWLGLRLIGGPRSSKDAIGSTVYLTANGMTQRADVFSGGSYASTSDMRPHFGLGQSTTVDKIEVHWPSGQVETFETPGVDRFITLIEGQGKPAQAKSGEPAAK
jgi:hypothetical protein